MPTITGTAGNDTLSGTDGDDVIIGLGGDDTINGGDGDDRIDSGSGVDVVNGGAGNDTLVISSVSTGFPAPSQTSFDGGSGFDTVDLSVFSFSPYAFWSYTSSTASLSVANYTFRNVENLVGSNGADLFNLGTYGGVLSISGGGGDDRISAGRGAVLIDGGAGRDELTFNGGSGTFLGGEGDDLIDAFQANTTGATLDGGNGVDTLLLTYQHLVADLALGTVSGFQATNLAARNFENVTIAAYGSSTQILRGNESNNVFKVDYDTGSTSVDMDGREGNDTIWGSRSSDILRGGADNDWLEGRVGNDQLYGDAGDDTLLGGAGNDTLVGGDGVDWVSFEDSQSAGVTASLFAGTAVSTDSGTDTFSGFENIRGSDFSDVLTGDGLANRLEGRSGIDTLRGGAGNDYLDGGSSADELYGEDGDDTLVGGSSADVIDGGSGNDTAVFTSTFASVTITHEGGAIIVSGTEGRDVLRGIETLQFADGIVDVSADGVAASETRRNLTGTAGADTLTGGGSRDSLSGGAGNDLLRGGGDNDTLDGGGGFDAALYSGARRQYTANSTTVSGNGEGTDTLTSIEEARFVDGVLTFDATSQSAQVMRLYSATLNRTPDQAGLEANVAAFSTYGLQGLANLFVASAEFQARFGALNNQQFVEQMYVFALGRTGDAPGIVAWVNLLNDGMSRGQVVVGFSESAENVTRTAATLAAGLWVPDAEAQIIARLYDATFDRLPDTAGLAGWVAILDTGTTSLQQIAAAFAGSAEFQARYGTLSNQQFVEQLYRFCLNREGDPAGISGWVELINNGMSRAQVLLGFSESPEHVALTAALWVGGIRYAGYIGAPLEDDAGVKGLHDALVLPEIDDAIIDDPADLGLTLGHTLTAEDADAFVLPSNPDIGFMPWVPVDDGDATAPGQNAALPMLDDGVLAFVVPVDLTDDLGTLFHRDGLDRAWA